MIRIVLLGRTGNHLFQYAFGRVLAQRHGVPLVMDGSWFHGEGWNQISYFLRLPLKARVVRRCSLGARVLRKITGRHYWEYRGVPVLKERPDDQSFDEVLWNAPADCVLMGYFQTPRYFACIAQDLRDELNGLLRIAWTAGAKGERASCPHAHSLSPSRSVGEEIAEQLASPTSVAVHVRRTDYLTLPVFQVCGEDYYRRAMDRMREWLGTPRFYIFSDDPEWCRRAFSEPDQEIVDGGPRATDPLHDLHLMSLASHHITVNSTYSWWAAWLGKKPGQRVIMPGQWFVDTIKAPIEEKRLVGWEVM